MKTVKGNQSSVFVCIIILMFLVFSGGCTSLKNLDLELEKESLPPPPDPIILAHPFTDVSVPGGFKKDQSKSFSRAIMSRVLVEEEMGGFTYSVQYFTEDKAMLDRYYSEDADRLRNESKRFAGKFVSFRICKWIFYEPNI